MCKGWAAMAAAAAATARDLAPARSSCASWEEEGGRLTAARFGVYGNEPILHSGTPVRNSAVLSTDGFLWGKTVGIKLSFTPIHLGVGISVLLFLALFVSPSA